MTPGPTGRPEDSLTSSDLEFILRMPMQGRRYSGVQIEESVERELRRMVADKQYRTNPLKRSRGNAEFVTKHALYLSTHPTINPSHYLSNLRTMTRIRR